MEVGLETMFGTELDLVDEGDSYIDKEILALSHKIGPSFFITKYPSSTKI